MTRFGKAALVFAAVVVGLWLTLLVREVLAWGAAREQSATTIERALVALERLADAEERQAAAMEREGGR